MMIKKFVALTFITIIFCAAANGQGSRTLPILYFTADARAAAMGEVTMGESTGTYLYTNPTSFLSGDKQVYGSYTFGLSPTRQAAEGRLNYHAVSAGYRLNKQAFMVGLRRLGGLKVPRVNDSGIEQKAIEPEDWVIDMAYTRALGEHFSAWLNGSIIRSDIGKTAYTGAASGGVYYRNTLPGKKSDEWNYCFGVSFHDVGGKVKYGNKSDNLPSSVGAGGSLAMPFATKHKVNIAVDTRYFALPSNASALLAGVGAEYELFGFAAVRAGYRFGDSNNHVTFGLGLITKYLNVDASYSASGSKNTEAVWRLGVTANF